MALDASHIPMGEGLHTSPSHCRGNSRKCHHPIVYTGPEGHMSTGYSQVGLNYKITTTAPWLQVQITLQLGHPPKPLCVQVHTYIGTYVQVRIYTVEHSYNKLLHDKFLDITKQWPRPCAIVPQGKLFWHDKLLLIIKCDSTLCVWMTRKQNGSPISCMHYSFAKYHL